MQARGHAFEATRSGMVPHAKKQCSYSVHTTRTADITYASKRTHTHASRICVSVHSVSANAKHRHCTADAYTTSPIWLHVVIKYCFFMCEWHCASVWVSLQGSVCVRWCEWMGCFPLCFSLFSLYQTSEMLSEQRNNNRVHVCVRANALFKSIVLSVALWVRGRVCVCVCVRAWVRASDSVYRMAVRQSIYTHTQIPRCRNSWNRNYNIRV